jgi:hypothetical protein
MALGVEMKLSLLCRFLILSLACCLPQSGLGQVRHLKLGESPTNNPLKGLVPYARPFPDRFPHSMEFNYLGLARLVVGPQTYDWQPMEQLLDDIASRGNQAVIRIYMEYPGKTDGIPPFLIEGGLHVHTYINTNTAPFPPTEVSTPDYSSELLRKTLTEFIEAFGAKYDGDPRLGYITAGLLGTWGEWHTYPRNDLWASKEVQTEIMDAYERAFTQTPILLRYPAGADHYDKAPNADRRFGYHDDSLCWATLETGKAEDNWFFVPALKAAGAAALNKWMTAPIGGEIRPEVWGKIFDDDVDIPQAQPFLDCAKALHLTWTMDTGMFREQPSPKRLANALAQVIQLGYEFYVVSIDYPQTASGDALSLSVHLINRGMAPMYHAWPVEFCAVNSRNEIQHTWKTGWNLMGILPKPEGVTMTTSLDITGLPTGNYTLLMRVVNPLPQGKPLQFANADWGTVQPGWLTLGPLRVDPPK